MSRPPCRYELEQSARKVRDRRQMLGCGSGVLLAGLLALSCHWPLLGWGWATLGLLFIMCGWCKK